MRLSHLADFIIYLDCFKNIDLHYSADYAFRLVLKFGDKVIMPVAVSPGFSRKKKQNWQIDQNEGSVTVSPVEIKFIEESKSLGLAIHYRIQYSNFQIDNLYIQHQDQLPLTELKTFRGQTLRLLKLQSRLLTFHHFPAFHLGYLPVVFYQEANSILQLIAGGCYTDFRIRKSSISLLEYVREGVQVQECEVSEWSRVKSVFLQGIKEEGIWRKLQVLHSRTNELQARNYNAMYILYQNIIKLAFSDQDIQLYKQILVFECKALLLTRSSSLLAHAFSQVKHERDPSLFHTLHQTLAESNKLYVHVMVLWVSLIDVLRLQRESVRRYLKNQFKQQVQKFFETHMVSAPLENKKSFKSLRSKIISEVQAKASAHLLDLQGLLGLASSSQPILFYQGCQNVIKPNKRIHVVVLVHGFKGFATDLRNFRTQLMLFFPQAYTINIKTNQNITNLSLDELGQNTAKQIIYRLRSLDVRLVGKLSFCGHSMGGLVIRAALRFLGEFSHLFGFYMSLSTPHLGLSYCSSGLVSMGVWILGKVQTNESIRNMSLKDSQHFESTFLYRISNQSNLQLFQMVFLLGSSADGYCSLQSALLLQEALSSQQIKTLIKNTKLPPRVCVDVQFLIDEKSMDSLIGRRAHIKFLDNKSLFLSLFCKYSKVFQ